MTYQEILESTQRAHPEWSREACIWQARKLEARLPAIREALDAGKERGRELRQRWKVGLGVDWPELNLLEPVERTFVLQALRQEILGARA